MVFPRTIEEYLKHYDPDAPIMIGRVISTASQSIPNAVGSIIHAATQAAQQPLWGQQKQQHTGPRQATWAALSSGIIISR